MNQYATMIRNLKSPEVMERLMHLYGRRDGMLVEQTGRYIGLLKRHEELFHENREVLMISAPGRTEIGGNHTDHQHGYGLAGAVTLDLVAVASRNEDGFIRVKSRGFNKLDVIDLTEAEPRSTSLAV